MNSITPQKAKFELETGTAIMFDLRQHVDYEFVYFDVDNVINIPECELSDVLHKYSKAKRIICADFDESIAVKAVNLLQNDEFTNVVYLEGGMKNWNTEKLPLKYNVYGSCSETDCANCQGCTQ